MENAFSVSPRHMGHIGEATVNEARISEYENKADAIARAVEGVPDRILNAAPGDDAWSIHEILIHLSDSEIVYSERLRRAIGDDDATVAPFDESAWGDRLHYGGRDARAALTLVRALRAVNADLLRRLDVAGWERTVTHSEAGPMTVARLVQTLVEHADYHIAQIDRIKAAHGLPDRAVDAHGAG